MIINNVNPDTGEFTGQYCSAVGDAEKFYTLTGHYDTASTTPTLGWTVTWQNPFKNAHSTTAWSGRYQYDSSGTPTLSTTWLHTSQTEPSDDWKSTKVGFAVFNPSPLSSEPAESSKGDEV